jgi:hypothetical protein
MKQARNCVGRAGAWGEQEGGCGRARDRGASCAPSVTTAPQRIPSRLVGPRRVCAKPRVYSLTPALSKGVSSCTRALKPMLITSSRPQLFASARLYVDGRDRMHRRLVLVVVVLYGAKPQRCGYPIPVSSHRRHLLQLGQIGFPAVVPHPGGRRRLIAGSPSRRRAGTAAAARRAYVQGRGTGDQQPLAMRMRCRRVRATDVRSSVCVGWTRAYVRPVRAPCNSARVRVR